MNDSTLSRLPLRINTLLPQAFSGSQILDVLEGLFGPAGRRVFLPGLLAAFCFGVFLAHSHTLFSPARHSVCLPATSAPASAEELRSLVSPGALRFASSGPDFSGERLRITLISNTSLPGGPVTTLPVAPAFDGYAGQSSGSGLLSVSDGKVTIPTIDGDVVVERLRSAASGLPFALPSSDGADPFSSVKDPEEGAPSLYGEDAVGEDYPAIWNWPAEDFARALALECAIARDSRAPGLSRFIRGIDLPPLPGSDLRAQKYRPLVQQYAAKYNLTPAMIMAVMHAESNFNPLAVSPNNALGLMQIVPETAGQEVYAYLTGLPGEPPAEALFSPEQNIRYGAIYLHLLARRYFNKVLNPASREMCVIAAYNGGPNAVLRTFDDDMDTAIARINALTPDELYQALITRAPNAETRRYVAVVLGHMRNYSVQ